MNVIVDLPLFICRVRSLSMLSMRYIYHYTLSFKWGEKGRALSTQNRHFRYNSTSDSNRKQCIRQRFRCG